MKTQKLSLNAFETVSTAELLSVKGGVHEDKIPLTLRGGSGGGSGGGGGGGSAWLSRFDGKREIFNGPGGGPGRGHLPGGVTQVVSNIENGVKSVLDDFGDFSNEVGRVTGAIGTSAINSLINFVSPVRIAPTPRPTKVYDSSKTMAQR